MGNYFKEKEAEECARLAYFHEKVECRYDVSTAMLIDKFCRLIILNAKYGQNFHQGKYWITCSGEYLEKVFSFWKKGQIYRLINKLIARGAILKTRLNSSNMDQTNSYTFSEPMVNELLNLEGYEGLTGGGKDGNK